MADETTGSVASVKIPQAQRVVPRRGERELAIGGNDDVGNEVVVAVKDTLRVTVLMLVTRELPDDDGLVCAQRYVSGFTNSLAPDLA